MSGKESCLLTKVSRYIEIGDKERVVLASLEHENVHYDKGSKVVGEGDSATHLFVVESGFLVGYSHAPGGGRQITRIYHPGDIIGLASLALKEYPTDVVSANSSVLCPFPRSSLETVFSEAPAVAALLTAFSSREQVLLMDMLKASNHLSAAGRLALLILMILYRLKVTDTSIVDRFELPLTQYDIGDAIGVTNVTVSRCMASFAKQGFLIRDGFHICIKDHASLRELCGYQDRYNQLDTAWFPDD